MTTEPTKREFWENCLARGVVGACCQYPDCGCFDALNYYKEHPEELLEPNIANDE